MADLTPKQRDELTAALHAAETSGGWWGHPECEEFARIIAPAVARMIAEEMLRAPRVEIKQERDKPSTCKVWLGNRLVFSGRDYSADLTKVQRHGDPDRDGYDAVFAANERADLEKKKRHQRARDISEMPDLDLRRE